jgi:hypothetical protein
VRDLATANGPERTIRDVKYSPPPKKPVFAVAPKSKQVKQVLPSIPAEAGPSKYSSSLAAMRQKADTRQTSDGAKKRYASEEPEIEGSGKGKGVERNEDDLTIKHNLRLGPKEHGLDPEGENEWLFNEPNAGIRLT